MGLVTWNVKLLTPADWTFEAIFQKDSSQTCTLFTYVLSRLIILQKTFFEYKIASTSVQAEQN